jgi:hypothetical protein
VGAHKGINIEKIHMDFCKRLLGVKRATCDVMMYVELGRYPLRANRIFNMITYNCILKSCYDTLYDMSEVQNCKNWATGVKEQLTEPGFQDVWSTQHMDKRYLPIIKQRILDQELQTIMVKWLLQMFTV